MAQKSVHEHGKSTVIVSGWDPVTNQPAHILTDGEGRLQIATVTQGLYECLGHATVTATLDPGGEPLTDLPADPAVHVRRTVLRNREAIEYTLDGTDPAGASMYALPDEVVVIDTDPTLIRLRGSGDVEVIYLGL